MDPNTVHIRKLIHSQDTRNSVHRSSSEARWDLKTVLPLHHDKKSYKSRDKSHHDLEATSSETSNLQSKPSNYDYRLRSDRKDNFPNGYLEDWSSNSSSDPSESFRDHPKNDKPTHKISPKDKVVETANPSRLSHQTHINKSIPSKHHKLLPYTSLKDQNTSAISLDVSDHSTFSLELSESELTDLIKSSDMSMPLHQYQKPAPISPTSVKYSPVSIILSTQSNILLNKDTSHNIRFSTGMVEGSGISINDNGDEITFQDDGSYRFEICGEATPFSDVDVKLIFYSPSFSDEVLPFSEITVPKDEGKLLLRGLATILPIQKGQKISPRLIPVPDESIVLMSNTRLLIHRVA